MSCYYGGCIPTFQQIQHNTLHHLLYPHRFPSLRGDTTYRECPSMLPLRNNKKCTAASSCYFSLRFSIVFIHLSVLQLPDCLTTRTHDGHAPLSNLLSRTCLDARSRVWTSAWNRGRIAGTCQCGTCWDGLAGCVISIPNRVQHPQHSQARFTNLRQQHRTKVK